MSAQGSAAGSASGTNAAPSNCVHCAGNASSAAGGATAAQRACAALLAAYSVDGIGSGKVGGSGGEGGADVAAILWNQRVGWRKGGAVQGRMGGCTDGERLLNAERRRPG